jgi:hypothetical protein
MATAAKFVQPIPIDFFVRHISRRCLDQTLWNLVGISCAMWSCAFKVLFVQNGCRCHGNGQNDKKFKKHKNDHSRLLAEQKLINIFFKSPLFLFPWQLRQSLSNRFRLFWLISFFFFLLLFLLFLLFHFPHNGVRHFSRKLYETL